MSAVLIGLIADTHGYLDPRVSSVLQGVDLIPHAGDIGAEEVLAGLASKVPVTAVIGNNDCSLAHLGLPLRASEHLEPISWRRLTHIVIDRPTWFRASW